MKKLELLLQKYPDARVLDVGTGVGNFIGLLTSITENFKEITGIDKSERMIELASNNFQNKNYINFKVEDGNNMQYEDGIFDIVCLSNSLHHLDDIEATLKEMRRVVKATGIILINEMICDNLSKAQTSHMLLHHFSAEIDRELGITHNDTYTKKEIIDVLNSKSNMEIDDYWDVDFGETPEITKEDLDKMISLVDRLVSRIKDESRMDYFLKKAQEIKEYIRINSYDSTTEVIFVLKK
ncbi:MAG: class I SAM-dependent methyltransferase [Bacilli bacterium]|nr:class I SAM-dependent methyltransferase [Bacilli bacterium]